MIKLPFDNIDLEKKPLLIIFDSHNLVYKSYFAVPKLHDKHNRPTNAIQGTCSILLKFFQNYQGALFCMTSDSKGGNFRHQMYTEYKAHRKEIEDDLLQQIILIPKFYEAFGLKIFAEPGYEADDFIASLVTKFKDQYTLLIVSSDKDLAQLICEGVYMVDPTKEVFSDDKVIVEKFGVNPCQIGDYLALIGDASDNIPGAKSVGPKTALKILNHGKLDDLLENPDLMNDKKLKQLILDNKENIILSKSLINLKSDIFVEASIDELRIDFAKQAPILYKLFGEYDINSLQRRIEKLSNRVLSSSDEAKRNAGDPHKEDDNNLYESSLSPEIYNSIWEQGVISICFAEVANLSSSSSGNSDAGFPNSSKYESEERRMSCVTFVDKEEAQDDNTNARRKNNVEKEKLKTVFKVYFNNKLYILDEVLNLKEILESSSIKKITYNAVDLEKKLIQDGIKVGGLYDLSILYYHLIGVKANNSLIDILYFLGFDDVSGQIAEQKNNYISFYEEIYNKGIEQLFINKHIEFFEEDRKVYKILRKMESIGILVDRKKLSDLKSYFENFLETIKDKVIDLTGYDFNILSPKQTSDVLFNKLELQPTKKSKNEGVFSTSQDILEELSISGVEVADYIMQYRSIYKLKSSYCDGLADQIDEVTGRIHTRFALNGATTGRILSSNPNLQNIPTRTEEGKKIRSCFIAKDGYKLVSADYSQIELRILAALADVKNLKTAFENGEDIHRLTASQIFGIPLKEIDDFWRSKAKAVNFGIIYGISPFGLSRQLKITTREADEIIKNYLRCYSEINEYLEKTKSFANRFGYVKTMFDRHCYLRTTNNLDKGMNFHERSFFERAAINAPIQGTASDIIKKSMIEIDYFINENNLRANSLLQIHDELIFEVHENDVELLSQNIVNIMESVGGKIDLKLKVDLGIGVDWLEL